MKTIIDLIRRANELMEKERYDEAEPFLLVVMKRDRKNPEAHYLLGEVYCKQQRFPESVTALEKANRFLPGNPNIIHLLGWATFMNGDIERGREHMKKALIKSPNDTRHLCDLAVLEMQDRNYVAAKTYARTALNLAPNDDMTLEVNAAVDAFGQAYQQTLQKN